MKKTTTYSRTSAWYRLPWKVYERQLLDMQFKIAESYISGNLRRTRKLIEELTKHEAAISIAVKRVTAKTSRRTPGIDGITWETPSKRLEGRRWLRHQINNLDSYKTQGVKRVWIPKEYTTELRPLGIPTVKDRAVQMLFLLAIEPVAECQADESSYGFRPFRGCATAITVLRSLLDKKFAQDTWIYDADLRKCFDSISHEFLLENTFIHEKEPLKQWLRAPIYETITEGPDKGKTVITSNDRGTPQGGVISPILCNIALNGIQTVIDRHNNQLNIKKFNKGVGKRTLHLVRYADDFVILSPSKDWIHHIINDLKDFLSPRGLEINEEKTTIQHITDGFNFLGWEIRRRVITRNNERKKRDDPYYQDSLLVIRPRPEKVAGLKRRLRNDVFHKKEFMIKPPHIIFEKHNELMRGWCCYYWISYHSQDVFVKLAHWQWYSLLRFFKRKHKGQKRTTSYIQKKYTLPHIGKESNTVKSHYRRWTWTVKRPDRRHPDREKIYRILDPSTIKHKELLNPKHDINIYTLEGRAYWEEWWNQSILFTNPFRSNIHQRDKLKCAVCGQSAQYYGQENEYGETETKIELHHIEPWIKSGNNHPDNLTTVHTECHPYYQHTDESNSDGVSSNELTSEVFDRTM